MASFVQEKFAEAVQAEDRAEWQRVLIGFEPDLGVCLLDAVRYRCPEAVRDVLNYRPFLNVEDGEGQRPIHLAARYGPPENVRLLLSAGCTVNASNREGWTPLHIACRLGDCAIVEELMSSGANVDAARTEEGLTPLHVAVQAGQEQVVQILLSRVDPDIRSSVKHGRVSALAMAVMHDRPRVLETLLKSAQGFFVSLCHKTRFIKHSEIRYTDVNGSFPLHIAVETGNVECCRLLLMYLQYLIPVVHHFGHGEDMFQEDCTSRRKRVLNLMNRHGCTALHSAILYSQKEMVEMLLDAGSNTDMSFEHMQLLELATRCAQPLNGARVYLPMDCPRRTAKIKEGTDWDESVVRLLLERSIDLDVVTKQGDYPIHLVLSAGLYGTAMMIIMRTPDKINHGNERGVTPLHLACQIRKKDRQPRLELIRSLLVMGLSVNQVTADGDTPLSLAVQDGDDEVVSILLEFSPDVNVRGSNGFRPLHLAAMGQNVAVLEALLDASPKALSIEDRCPSPLHLAISCTRVEMVECLLKRQADPSQRHPGTSETPLHAAIQLFMGSFHCHASVAMIKLLVKAGADLDARNTRTAGSLTPLQSMIHSLLCCSMFPNGRERSNELGLSALKTLVEAGSRLEPWTPSETGFMRRTPLQSMAFCGMLPCVYYLANIGWPLATENPPPSNGDESGNNQNMPLRQNWMCLPGNSVAQDNLHAFLMLRNANPFSLLQLAGIAIRKSLVEKSIRTHGGQRREIVSQIEKLPVPEVMKKYLNWQDVDYSSAECSWEKMLHLLPSAAAKEAAKAGLTS